MKKFEVTKIEKLKPEDRFYFKEKEKKTQREKKTVWQIYIKQLSLITHGVDKITAYKPNDKQKFPDMKEFNPGLEVVYLRSTKK